MGGHHRRYIHGYSSRESQRLHAQAELVREMVHGGTNFPAGSHVLEIGCGTGAQTVALARNSPGAHFVAVDRSTRSLGAAAERARAAVVTNVEFRQADILALPFDVESFDHVFGSFVLEHLARPLDALTAVAAAMKRGASITLFEGDHGSVLLYPASDAAVSAIACQAELQRRAGGDATVGRQLFPLLTRAGFCRARITPSVMYVDGNRPDLGEQVDRTFAAMVAPVRNQAITTGLIDGRTFDTGIADVRRAIRHGVFSYTFFKAIAWKTT